MVGIERSLAWVLVSQLNDGSLVADSQMMALTVHHNLISSKVNYIKFTALISYRIVNIFKWHQKQISQLVDPLMLNQLSLIKGHSFATINILSWHELTQALIIHIQSFIFRIRLCFLSFSFYKFH